MIRLIVLLILIGFNSTIAQTSDKKLADTLITVGIDANVAKEDIKNGVPKLLLKSGIAGTEYSDQAKFEAKYTVKYFDYGCVGPDRKELTNYNQEIFKYLDKTYGRVWRKEVRKDVVGFR